MMQLPGGRTVAAWAALMAVASATAACGTGGDTGSAAAVGVWGGDRTATTGGDSGYERSAREPGEPGEPDGDYVAAAVVGPAPAAELAYTLYEVAGQYTGAEQMCMACGAAGNPEIAQLEGGTVRVRWHEQGMTVEEARAQRERDKAAQQARAEHDDPEDGPHGSEDAAVPSEPEPEADASEAPIGWDPHQVAAGPQVFEPGLAHVVYVDTGTNGVEHLQGEQARAALERDERTRRVEVVSPGAWQPLDYRYYGARHHGVAMVLPGADGVRWFLLQTDTTQLMRTVGE